MTRCSICGVVIVVCLAADAAAATYGPGPGCSIPDNIPSGTSSSIEVVNPANPLITEVIGVTITGLTHTYAGDLRATLSHNGVTVDLFSRLGKTSIGGASDSSDLNGDYTFSADGPSFLAAAQQGDTSYVIPPGTYARSTANPNLTDFFDPDDYGAFVGRDVNGTWTLTVSDHVYADIGGFTGWTLEAISIPESGTLAFLGLAGLTAIRSRR